MNEFRVAVLTPSTGICRMGYAQSMSQMVRYYANVRVFDDEPNQMLITYAVEGSGIAQNYENMVDKFLKDPEVHWTHFLSVEDDMIFDPRCLHMLARHRLPVVGANYSTNKGDRQRFTAVGLEEEDGKLKSCLTTDESTGLEEVSLLPQGFTLVAREVYEALAKPWFMMGWNEQREEYVYQDYFFSEMCRRVGFKLYVDHDVSKLIGHVGPYVYTYKDALRDTLAVQEP